MLVRRRALIEVAGSITAGKSWTLRRSLLLVLEDDEGRLGFGEASPVPGWSREEIATSRWALEALSNMFEIDPEIEAIDALVREIPPVLASARFALETALYDLVAKRRGVSVASLFDPKQERMPLCQTHQEGEPVRATTVKVQAGLHVFSDELERLSRVRAAIGPNVKLRVDFARTIPAIRLYDSLCRLRDLGVDLVEEAAPPEQILKMRKSPIPLALDESLLAAGELLEDLAGLQLIRTIVLRPMLIGGARVAQRLGEWAEQLGLSVTVGHCFDGPVAHAMSSVIALALPGEVLPPELWPHAGLRYWGERELPHLDGASIVSPKTIGLGVGALS